MNIQEICFDFDGVLVDSLWFVIKWFQLVAEAEEMPIPECQTIACTCGMSFVKALEELTPGLTVERATAIAERIGIANQIVPQIPYVSETLDTLRAKYRLSIVSNRQRVSLRELLENAHIEQTLFDFIQAGDDTKYLKPDPRVFHPLIARARAHGIEEDGILFVGDSVYDLEAARGTKMNFRAVLSGGTSKEKFLALGVPDECILPSIRYIPAILNGTRR
jgi:HAD superfamily hydrolase (TIGR01549 family)